MNNLIKNIFSSIDHLWIKRRRKVDTMTIVSAVHQSAISHRGLNHILTVNDVQLSAAALCKARQKLPEGCFKKALCDVAHVNECGRIFAVDGSKVHLPASFINKGFTTRTNNQKASRPAKRPLAMLSSIVDVRSSVCVDYTVTSHFNERKAFREIIDNNTNHLKAGDTFVFDRGYFSAEMVTLLNSQQMDFIFRLKRDAFTGVKAFFNSSKHYCLTKIRNIPVALVKYMVDGKKFVCLTSTNVSPSIVKDTYKKRWRVEEHFKRLKSYLGLERVVSVTPRIYLQDVEIRIFLDWISLQCKKFSSLKKSQIVVLDKLPALLDWTLSAKVNKDKKCSKCPNCTIVVFYHCSLTTHLENIFSSFFTSVI